MNDDPIMSTPVNPPVNQTTEESDWHKAEGRCNKCNLKGFTKQSASKNEKFIYVPCRCLVKTLVKAGIEANVEYKVVTIEHVETMIAMRKPEIKKVAEPAVFSAEPVPQPA